MLNHEHLSFKGKGKWRLALLCKLRIYTAIERSWGGSCQRLHSSSNCLKNNRRRPVRCPHIRLLGNCHSCTWAHDNYWAEAKFILLCNRANSIFYLHYQWNMTKLCRPRLACNLKTIFLICLFSESVVSNVFNLKLLCNVLKLYSFYRVHFPPSHPTSVKTSSSTWRHQGQTSGTKALLCTCSCCSKAIFRELLGFLTFLAIP